MARIEKIPEQGQAVSSQHRSPEQDGNEERKQPIFWPSDDENNLCVSLYLYSSEGKLQTV